MGLTASPAPSVQKFWRPNEFRALPSQVCQAGGHAALIQTCGLPPLTLVLFLWCMAGPEISMLYLPTPGRGARVQARVLAAIPSTKEVSKELKFLCLGPPQDGVCPLKVGVGVGSVCFTLWLTVYPAGCRCQLAEPKPGSEICLFIAAVGCRRPRDHLL